ncbi:MAG TPA: hypothetical protein VHB79_39200 [Polyangiaceae bacterium]|nr:hypothetical protein [Polyangiaceae bacterium]
MKHGFTRQTSGRVAICAAALLLGCSGRVTLAEQGPAQVGASAGSGGDGSGSGGASAQNAPSGTAGFDDTPRGIGGFDPPEGAMPDCGRLDGTSYIAFDTDRDNFDRELYMVHPNGTGLRRLTNRDGRDQEPAFSADGKQLAFTSDRDGTLQIHLMDLATGDVRQLTHQAGGADRPALSHDGKRLAFHSGPSLYTMALDGTDEHLVATGPDDLNGYTRPGFTPDDQHLVFDRNNEIDTSLVDGSNLRYVVPDTTMLMHAPAISSNGVDVAYDLGCYFEPGRSIWVSPITHETPPCEGVRITPVGQFDAEHPTWSPTGECLAYVHVDVPRAVGRITIITGARNSVGAALTDGSSDDRNPAWSP